MHISIGLWDCDFWWLFNCIVSHYQILLSFWATIMVGNPRTKQQNTWNMFLFGRQGWSQSQWLKSGKHQWGWDCFFIPLFSVVLYMRGPKWSGFQPTINTPCQFEKVFLILSTTSEGFFPLELSSKWWRDFWTTINGNVHTQYSCVHMNMYTYRNTHDYRNHRAFGCSLLSLEYWDKTLLDFLVSSQSNLTANQLPMRHDCF